MKTYFVFLTVALFVALSLVFWPAWQLYNHGYMNLLGYLALTLGVATLPCILFYGIRILLVPRNLSWRPEYARISLQKMGWFTVIVFFFVLATSSFWFDFITEKGGILKNNKNIVYDTQTQAMFRPDNVRVYIWNQPESYRVIPEAKFFGRVSDYRDYSRSVMGEIIDPDSMAWKTLFYLDYTLPEQHRLQFLKAGYLPSFGVKVHMALNNAVDVMYRQGFETFKTTQSLKVALHQEIERQCAVVFQTDKCLMDLTLHIPYAPIPHSAAPPDNSL